MTNKFYGNQVRSPLWIRAKKGLANTFKGYAQIGTMVVMVYVVGLLGAKYLAVPVRAEVPVDVSDSRFAAKIEILKDEVVNQVGPGCESKGYNKDQPVLVFDSNSKASVGAYQLQIATVQYYYKTLYGKSITPKEAVLVALDNDKAHQLAKDVMFKTQNMASKDWYTCSQKNSSDAQIKLIKALEK